MIYEKIFRQLNKHRVKYLVAGGVAVVLHGVVRFTADLDLFVKLTAGNWAKFIKVMKKLGYRPKLPVKLEEFADKKKREQWIREKGMRVFSFHHAQKQLELIDIFVKEYIDFASAYKRKKIVSARGVDIPLVCIEDLKRLKRISHRAQDLADIGSLEKLEKIIKEEKRKNV